MPSLQPTASRVCLVIDNNIFDLFDEPLVGVFPDFELVYLREVYQEGQAIPATKQEKKIARTISEADMRILGYTSGFPLKFPVHFISHEYQATFERHSNLGETDACLIATLKHSPRPCVLLTRDGLGANRSKTGLIKAAESEGIVVATGFSREELIENIEKAVQHMKEMQHA